MEESFLFVEELYCSGGIDSGIMMIGADGLEQFIRENNQCLRRNSRIQLNPQM